MTDYPTRFEAHFRANFMEDLTRTLENAKGENVYACAFGTDDDWTTLFLAVNTEESLARHVADMKSKGLCDTAQDEIYYRWGLSEYQYGSDTHLNGISDLMYEAEDAAAYKEQMIAVIADAVRGTDEAVFEQYGQKKADIVFFVSMTDADEAEALENETVGRMTEPALADDFLKRYDG